MNNITNLASPSSFPLGNENEGSHCSRLIKTFNHEQFGQIRICQDSGKEWFCLSDVCKALSLAIPARVKERLSERGIHSMNTPTYNQYGTMVMQAMTYIDEANLYRCIFQSRKAEAEQFQCWVFEVVLPQIRKTGGYIPVNEEDDEKTILCKALNIMQKTIEKKDAIIEAQRPKVQFADALTAGKDSILIRDLAKLLTQNGFEIGQNRLFAWLRKHGYLFQNETRPIQKWVEKGIFDYDVRVIENGRHIIESITTKVTGKGQEYFINGFLSGKMSFNQ